MAGGEGKARSERCLSIHHSNLTIVHALLARESLLIFLHAVHQDLRVFFKVLGVPLLGLWVRYLSPGIHITLGGAN